MTWRHAGPSAHPALPDLEQLETAGRDEAVLATCLTCQRVVLLVSDP